MTNQSQQFANYAEDRTNIANDKGTLPHRQVTEGKKYGKYQSFHLFFLNNLQHNFNL